MRASGENVLVWRLYQIVFWYLYCSSQVLLAKYNIFAYKLLCYDIGVLNFPDDVRIGVMILEAIKEKKVSKYCDIIVVYFRNNVLNSFTNRQSFCFIVSI